MPPSQTVTVHPDRRHWTLAVVAGMASFLDSSIIVATGIYLAIWADAFHFSVWMSGAISAFLTFSIAAGALVGGRISDVLGRTRIFNLDMAVYAIGVALIAVANGQTMILVGVILAGLAAGADLPTSVAVVSERAPNGAQGRLVGFTQVMWTIGILVTTGLGFALSTTGIAGSRVMFGWLTAIAVATWLVRVLHRGFRALETEIHPTGEQEEAMPLRELLGSRPLMLTLVLTGTFYIAWGLLANTFGQFQTYFLVTVSHASQTLATGLGLALIPIGLIFSIVYVRVLDTRWRNPTFYAGAGLQIVAMILVALSTGAVLPLLVAGLALYNVSNCFAGEATYKVWTQEGFPINARATVQGVSYGIGRTCFALFALVTPAILSFSPVVLLWMLVGFAVLTLVLGSASVHQQGPPGARAAVLDEDTTTV